MPRSRTIGVIGYAAGSSERSESVLPRRHRAHRSSPALSLCCSDLCACFAPSQNHTIPPMPGLSLGVSCSRVALEGGRKYALPSWGTSDQTSADILPSATESKVSVVEEKVRERGDGASNDWGRAHLRIGDDSGSKLQTAADSCTYEPGGCRIERLRQGDAPKLNQLQLCLQKVVLPYPYTTCTPWSPLFGDGIQDPCSVGDGGVASLEGPTRART
jgi:hypothetical protein